MREETTLIPVVEIEHKIRLVRGQKIILASDLAVMYGVTTSNLNKAVKRNLVRFPSDFMFQLSQEEYSALRFQIGILEKGKHAKYLPYAFTEQGIAMLSSVLRSPRAVLVNIEIMRAFVRLRQILSTNAELAGKLEELEKKYDSQFRVVFEAIRQLMALPEPKRKQIGFQAKESRTEYIVRRKNK